VFLLEEELGLGITPLHCQISFFDYIQARVPVLVYQLPEMKKIVKDYCSWRGARITMIPTF